MHYLLAFLIVTPAYAWQTSPPQDSPYLYENAPTSWDNAYGNNVIRDPYGQSQGYAVEKDDGSFAIYDKDGAYKGRTRR